MKNKKALPIISIILIVIPLLLFGIYYLSGKRDKIIVKELEDSITQTDSDVLKYYLINNEVVQEKFKSIFMRNTDFIGWITIDGTKINYPVMYKPDDIEYYLHRNFEQKYNFAGTIFAGENTDITKPSKNIILYGHNMNDGSMFHQITKYVDEEYYKTHKYIKFDTLNKNSKYEIVAVFRTIAHNEDYIGFDLYRYVNMERNRFNEFHNECISARLYNAADFNYEDNLITLSTCQHFADNGRFVVIAKEIEKKEVDITTPPINILTVKNN